MIFCIASVRAAVTRDKIAAVHGTPTEANYVPDYVSLAASRTVQGAATVSFWFFCVIFRICSFYTSFFIADHAG